MRKNSIAELSIVRLQIKLLSIESGWFCDGRAIANRAKFAAVVLPFELAFEGAIAGPNLSQNKSNAPLAGDGTKPRTRAFTVFSQPFVQIVAPAEVMLGRTRRVNRPREVKKINAVHS